jgi:hypothetical protein
VTGNFLSEEDGWTPEFEGQRPPFAEGHEYRFAEGNQLSVRHGAFSARKIDPVANELADELLDEAHAPGSSVSYLTDPTYRPAIRAWAVAESRQELLENHLADVGGPIDAEGKVRPAAELLERVARGAERMRARLGLDPMSRATLARDLAMARSSHELDRLKVLGQALLDATHDDAEETTAGDGKEGDDD